MTRRRCLGLLAGVLAGGSLVVAGCNIAVPAAYLIGGLPKIDAEFELPDVPTVVFVDDRGNTIGSNARALRLAIADKTSEDLMVQEVLVTTIRPSDAMAAASSRDRHGELLPIDAIGREVGADQVIYVEVIAFAVTADGMTPQPTSMCRVRVIDVANRQRLFPPADGAETARTIQAQLPEIDPGALQTRMGVQAVFRALAEETGQRVGQLFYRHEERPLGERLKPR